MKHNLATEWLKASYSDIIVIDSIVNSEAITHMTAFHSQQSVEKSLKAILEFYGTNVPKKHDVRMLKKLVATYITIEDDYILDSLNTLYIDSRYPGEMGLLPNGKPTLEDAKEFYEFALDIFNRVCKLLEINPEDLKP